MKVALKPVKEFWDTRRWMTFTMTPRLSGSYLPMKIACLLYPRVKSGFTRAMRAMNVLVKTASQHSNMSSSTNPADDEDPMTLSQAALASPLSNVVRNIISVKQVK